MIIARYALTPVMKTSAPISPKMTVRRCGDAPALGGACATWSRM
jgi:hypothetical protein